MIPSLRSKLSSQKINVAGNQPDIKRERIMEVPEIIQHEISPQTLKLLRSYFKYFDKDNSGLLNIEELGIFMRSLGYNPPEQRLKDIIAYYDKDCNGNLSFGEFTCLWYDYRVEAAQDQELIIKAFEYLDQDESKAISLSEFKTILTETGDSLTEEELDLFFKLIDKNKDGVINFEELQQFLRNPDLATQLFQDYDCQRNVNQLTSYVQMPGEDN